MRINTNLNSIFAQCAQFHAQNSIGKQLERLSTGLRINRASDDAAGLSISENLRTQVRGMGQAMKNVQDAMSLFNIQEGVLNSVHECLQRMRELSVEAASDTLSDLERGYLQEEVRSLVDEIDRYASRPEWMGQFRMDGTMNRLEETARGNGGAVPPDVKIQLYNPGIFAQYLDRPVRITVLQEATTQQVDTAAERSTHVQETFRGVANALSSVTSVVGTAPAATPLTATFVTTENDPFDAIVRLRRRHDNAVLDPSDYTILSALPIPDQTAFQIQITDPSAAIYTKIAEAHNTNRSTGVTRFGYDGCDVIELMRVQSNSFSDRFLGDADGQVTLSEPGVSAVGTVEIRQGAVWTALREAGAGNVGETVYVWDGAQTVRVGVKQLDGSIVAAGPYDVWVVANSAARNDIAEFAAAADGEMAYRWDGARTLVIGRKEGAVLRTGPQVFRVYVDYRANENQYTVTYRSYNKFRLTSGERDADDNVLFAQNLYAGTNIPADLTGSRRMEVRINGHAPETNYRFYPVLDNRTNVIVFDTGPAAGGDRTITGPVAGALITIDYATPSGLPVDWSLPTLGESTNDDGSVAYNEARSKDGVFNDFWANQATRSITISQPYRNKTMTVLLNPSWSAQDLIDAINLRAQETDLEAEAYWDGSEVKIRPGTSGWKDRPLSGWEGSLFYLEASSTVIGPGATGDLRGDQNNFSAGGPMPSDSIISVVLDDTGEVIHAAHLSRSNQHDLPSMGFIVPVGIDSVTGGFSVLEFDRQYIQAGANAPSQNRIVFSVPEITAEAIGVDNANVGTQAQARFSIELIDDAINKISGTRTYLGTMVNRCEFTLKNLSSGQANTAWAESLVRDADFATETVGYVRAKILQQSSLAYMAQANFLPTSMLKLL
jgi:flagellin-like hook-associated protein FlgL